MALSKSDPDLIDAVAYAIGKVIATQNVALTPSLASLDGIGKASAIHTMACGMVSMLQGEALAAIEAVVKWPGPELVE